MTLIPNSIHTARFTKIMTKPPEDMEWDDARDQVQRTYTWLRRARQAPPGDDLLDELSRADAVATACSALREALVVFGALTYTPGESHNEHNQLHSTPPPPQSIGELDAPNSELDTATSPEREPGTTPPDTTPVTAGALSELQQALNNRAFEGELSDTMSEAETLLETRERVKKAAQLAHDRLKETPSKLSTRGEISREADLLLGAGSLLEAWSQLDKDANLKLTTWLTHRARAAQDAARRRNMPLPLQQLTRLFHTLSKHSKRSRPGIICGLAQEHEPAGPNWLTDARASELAVLALFGDAPTEEDAINVDDELRKLTAEVHEGIEGAHFAARARSLLTAGVSPRHTRLVRMAKNYIYDLPDDLSELRRAAAAEIEADLEDNVEATQAPSLPTDWPWLSHTLGKRAVIVGGDPRPHRVARLKGVFGFADMDWLDNTGGPGSRLNSLLQRMRHGTVDIVIMTRAFSSHTLTDATFALKDRRCELVLADSYGAQQIRMAIERYIHLES